MLDHKSSLIGYRERISRIALFDVFKELDRKKGKDNVARPIDYYGLLMLTLLFFFECMLTRTKTSGVIELSHYLKTIVQKYYVLSDEAYIEIARQLIGALRPVAGKRISREFLNFESGEQEIVEFAYLKVSGWDKDSNQQFYTLDEQGLELVFASKEYFNEFQISISQLILRKQLEKNEFDGALRQIDEMRISVHGVRDKIITIKHEIQQNIVSDEVYERYKNLIGDINSRLAREHEEFEEITLFVRQTKEHYERDMTHSSKDKKAYKSIIRVDNELMEVHNLHSRLLKESIELKTKALESARETMYYVGLTSFNFKQEIVGKVLHTPLPFEETKLMAKPFMGIEKAEIWTPLSLFARQRIVRKEYETKISEFLEVDEAYNEEEISIRKRLYDIVFSNILSCMGEEREITLEELTKRMEAPLVNMKELYELFLIMHQLSPMNVTEIQNVKEHIFSDALSRLSDPNLFLEVNEIGGNTVCVEDIEISNMTLKIYSVQEIKESE